MKTMATRGKMSKTQEKEMKTMAIEKDELVEMIGETWILAIWREGMTEIIGRDLKTVESKK